MLSFMHCLILPLHNIIAPVFCDTEDFHASHHANVTKGANGVCRCITFYGFTGPECDEMSPASYFCVCAAICVAIFVVYAMYESIRALRTLRKRTRFRFD